MIRKIIYNELVLIKTDIRVERKYELFVLYKLQYADHTYIYNMV